MTREGAISGSEINEQHEKDFRENVEKTMKQMSEELCKRLFLDMDHIEWKDDITHFEIPDDWVIIKRGFQYVVYGPEPDIDPVEYAQTPLWRSGC